MIWPWSIPPAPQYEVVENEDLEEFQKRVETRLLVGWTLVGGIETSTYSYRQNGEEYEETIYRQALALYAR